MYKLFLNKLPAKNQATQYWKGLESIYRKGVAVTVVSNWLRVMKMMSLRIKKRFGHVLFIILFTNSS